jgi:hydroxypyruvate reductase
VSTDGARAQALAILRAALRAVDGERVVREAVRADGAALSLAGRPVPAGVGLVVAALGKAAVAMAAGLEAAAGPRIVRGLVVTKEGHGADALASGRLPAARWTLRESAHPVPDARCEAGARALLDHVASARVDDVLVVLLSGGASALLACPLPGLALAELADTTEALLASGAEIGEINAVRKHLVEVAGGRLAHAAGAGRIEVLAISDVIGDRLDVIGSGPCAPDPTRFADALEVVDRRALRERLPRRVLAHLEAGARGERAESPKPADPVFARVRTTLLASNGTALAAARRDAEARGLPVVVASASLRGEARRAGARMAALARAARPRPVCLLAGGETTVTLRGRGRGGRCQELALAAALAWDGQPDLTLLAAGTDGSDGPTDAAGAYADGGTVARGAARGVDARAALADNDAYGFFAAEGGLVRIGPTGTNVMDLVLVLAGTRG